MSQENLETVQTLYGRWARGDFATPEFFDPDVEYVRIGDDGALAGVGSWRGLDQMWAAVTDYLSAWEDVRQVADRFVLARDDRVLVLDRQLARGRTTGIPVEREMAALFTLNDAGKIVRFENFWNRDEALEAVGLRE